MFGRSKSESQDPNPDGLNTSAEQQLSSTASDNPIRSSEEDLLGRAKAAYAFADQMLSFQMDSGLVVGVLGAWGSGKTSFVNLARTRLKSAGVEVLDFNPWMFSGAEQLVDSFFLELSAQLKLKPDLSTVGKTIEEYGEMFAGLAWVPVFGTWIERVRAGNKMLGKILQSRKEGVGSRRAKVEAALKQLSRPFAVVIDDIDRLTSREIRDIFKLVRLTANFPNVVYILAFDRIRVEGALKEEGISGRDYIEKILQVAIDIPSMPPELLNKQALLAIERAVSPIETPGVLHADAWPDIYYEVIRPLIRNMRDVRRYAGTIGGAVRSLNGQVALEDLLALEAIRVFLPDVFREIHGSIAALTSTHDEYGDRAIAPRLKEQIERMIGLAEQQGNVIRSLIERMFPAAQRHIGTHHVGGDWKREWIKGRRVAHGDVLRLYLEKTAGPGFQTISDAEKAWANMSNQAAFDDYLRSLDRDRLQDVIAALETYEGEFRPDHVVPGSVVLFNLLPLLPEQRAGMFELNTVVVVGRVVLRLLRSLQTSDAIEAAVQQSLPQLNTLWSLLELIDLVGYRENVGHKLISETAAKGLERAWRAELRAADPDLLASERGLLWMMLWAKKQVDAAEPPITVPRNPSVTLGILKSARSEVLGQALGNRAVQRTSYLAWDELIELFGNEQILRSRIEELKTSQLQTDDELLALVDRYLAGERPGHHPFRG